MRKSYYKTLISETHFKKKQSQRNRRLQNRRSSRLSSTSFDCYVTAASSGAGSCPDSYFSSFILQVNLKKIYIYFFFNLFSRSKKKRFFKITIPYIQLYSYFLWSNIEWKNIAVFEIEKKNLFDDYFLFPISSPSPDAEFHGCRNRGYRRCQGNWRFDEGGFDYERTDDD